VHGSYGMCRVDRLLGYVRLLLQLRRQFISGVGVVIIVKEKLLNFKDEMTERNIPRNHKYS